MAPEPTSTEALAARLGLPPLTGSATFGSEPDWLDASPDELPAPDRRRYEAEARRADAAARAQQAWGRALVDATAALRTALEADPTARAAFTVPGERAPRSPELAAARAVDRGMAALRVPPATWQEAWDTIRALRRGLVASEHAAVQPAIDRFRGALSDERLETAARDGLTTAALAWSPDGATPFATYAAWWIRAALTKATNDATPLPRARPFEAWAASAEAAPNDVPTPDEVRRLLAERPDAVTDRQRQVLHARYGLDDGTPRSLIEVGAAIGLSRERVRSIERDALSALRGETDGG